MEKEVKEFLECFKYVNAREGKFKGEFFKTIQEPGEHYPSAIRRIDDDFWSWLWIRDPGDVDDEDVEDLDNVYNVEFNHNDDDTLEENTRILNLLLSSSFLPQELKDALHASFTGSCTDWFELKSNLSLIKEDGQMLIIEA